MNFDTIINLSGQELYDKALGFKGIADYDNYFMHLVMAANYDHLDAQKLLEIENIRKPDYYKTLPFYEATKNYSYSLCVLGNIYNKTDYVKAKQYYEEAISKNNNNLIAMYKLGSLYKNGYGMNINTENKVKGFQLLKAAVDQGSIIALCSLGHCYHHGYGTNIDYKKAKELYELAISKYDGFSTAYNNLGVLYKSGLGVKRDKAKGKELYEKATSLGSDTAMSNLGHMYEEDKDYTKAIELYEKSIKENNKNAMIKMAKLYQNGLGVSIDLNKAKDLYEKAIKGYLQNPQVYTNEIVSTLTQLCQLYQKNNDLKKDVDHVVNYFNEINKIDYIKTIYGFDDFVMSLLRENIKLKKKNDEIKKISL